ncbi:MAG: hypothetical protein ACPH06_07795, partial [Flavobacteriaceae bacterium]
MKKSILALFALATLGLTSCSSDDDNNGGSTPTPNANVVSVTGSIEGQQTWTSDNIYQLNQKVVVQDGAILTIEPGTIIKGSSGTGSL